jgi:hypothetical protein
MPHSGAQHGAATNANSLIHYLTRSIFHACRNANSRGQVWPRRDNSIFEWRFGAARLAAIPVSESLCIAPGAERERAVVAAYGRDRNLRREWRISDHMWPAKSDCRGRVLALRP